MTEAISTKTCSACLIEKGIAEYYFHKPTGKPRARCKECSRQTLTEEQKRIRRAHTKAWTAANKERARAGYKSWEKANPEKVRAKKLKTCYGITIADYDGMFLAQGGACAICRRPQSNFKKRLEVDHDHVTGKVRGLLCGDCNKTLGKIKDSVETAQRMVDYLLRSLNG